MIIKSDDNFWHMFLQIRGRYMPHLPLMLPGNWNGREAYSDASDADLGSWGSI